MAEPANFPAGHALIIGTGTDRAGNKSGRFQSTINDAEWLADVLKDSSLCAYPEHQVKLLVGENATHERILEELDALKTRVFNSDQRCTVVISFSGHGVAKDKKHYLLPYDYRDDDQVSRAIGGDLLYDKLRAIDGRILLLLNACHSGGVMPKLGTDDDDDQEFPDPIMPLNERHINRLLEGKGFAYLCAAQASRGALTGFSEPLYGFLPAMASKKYSVFTLGLARGLSGRDRDGGCDIVYFSELAASCIAYVTTRTNQKQLPYFDFRGDNFAVGSHKYGAARRYPLLGDDITFDTDIADDYKSLPVQHTGATNTKIKNNVGASFVGVNNFTGNCDFSVRGGRK